MKIVVLHVACLLVLIYVSYAGWFTYLNNYIWELFVARQTKIVGGNDAVFGQYPHQVMIKTVDKGKVRICGGSLISDRHVLTAAHCLFKIDYAILLFGTIYTALTTAAAIQVVLSNNFVVHPNFDAKTIQNDIAIIHLNAPLKMTNLVNSIRLPKFEKTNSYFYEGKNGVVTGWGITSDNNKKMAKVLQQTRVTIMKHHICRAWFGFFGYHLTNSQLCSSSSQRTSGTAQGDSGGPLVILENDMRFTLVGIVSFGDAQCESGSPSVYTNVAIFLPWVRQVTGIKLRKRRNNVINKLLSYKN